MQKNILFVLSLMFSLTSFSQPSSPSQSSPPSSSSSSSAFPSFEKKIFYIDGNLGLTVQNSTFVAGGADLGYQFSKHLAVEFGYTRTEYINIFDVALKGILPINDKNELFGKIGPAIQNYDSVFYNPRHYDTGVFLAGGISHHLNSNFSIGAQVLDTVVSNSANVSDNLLAVLGTLSYRFDN